MESRDQKEMKHNVSSEQPYRRLGLFLVFHVFFFFLFFFSFLFCLFRATLMAYRGSQARG